MTATQTSEVHGLHRAEFVAMMSMVSATIALSIDTVLPAFDEIERTFGLDAGSQVSLTVTIFLVGLGLGTIIYGPLSDRFGRKAILYGSLTIFVIGALVSTMAPSFGVFLAGRAVWGFGAAGPRALTLAIIRDSYVGDTMARIMSFTSAVFLIVPVMAPGVGELLLRVGSWRWTTGISVILGVAVGVWFTRVRETLAPEDVLPLEFGRVARAAKQVMTNRSTVLYTVAAMMAYGAFFPWLGSSVQMIGEIYDRPDQFALLFGANALLMAAVILGVGRLIKAFGTYPVLLVESIGLVVAALVFTVVSRGSDGVPGFWTFFVLAGILTAINSGTTPLMQTLSMEPMGAIAGTASSVTGVALFVGGALLGSIIDARIDTSVTPFGVGFLIYGAIGLAAVIAAGRGPRTAPSPG